MNSNSTATLSSCKTNLSFFKKRIAPKINQNPQQNSPKEEPIIFLTSRKITEKQLPKNIEERIKYLEEEINNENIQISNIKELLELCVVFLIKKKSIIINILRKQLSIMNQ